LLNVVATGAGAMGAVLHFAGALKAVPPLAALPVDLTVLALAGVVAGVVLLLAGRELRLSAWVGPPVLACGALWSWWVLAATWSPWPAEAMARLRDIVLVGPLMLGAGLVLGADAGARRGFLRATLVIGPLVGVAVAYGLATGSVVLGGEVGRDPTRLRVAYQVVTLALACAAGLAALRCAIAAGWARLGWGLLLAALAVAALLPGGRAGLLGLLAAVTLAPCLLFTLQRRMGHALGWAGCVALAIAGGWGVLALAPALLDDLATLERLLRPGGGVASAREIIWTEAWRLGGWVGLGPGGFPPALGVGLGRGLHPHNHALEALIEGGAVGLLLWGVVFLGGALLAVVRAFQVAPERAAAICAVCLPVALSAMVSTDLGNRMVWFALGLALSLGAETRSRIVAPAHAPADV